MPTPTQVTYTSNQLARRGYASIPRKKDGYSGYSEEELYKACPVFRIMRIKYIVGGDQVLYGTHSSPHVASLCRVSFILTLNNVCTPQVLEYFPDVC